MTDSIRGRFNRSFHILGVAFLALVVGLAAGACTTRTAGMQSPLGHDYDGVQWRLLDNLVFQPAIVAPAYTALVENDPATDADALRARIERLPDDARESELVEIRIAVRPLDEGIFDAGSTVAVAVLDQEGRPLDGSIERPLVSLAVDGDWLIIDDVPAAKAGDGLLIELRPGDSSGPGWEYAVTPGRRPYGGEPASIGEEGRQLTGAIEFQTIFAQHTDTGTVAGEVVDSVGDGFFGDPLLGLLYAGLLAGIVALVRLGRWSGKARQGDGR